jgi:small subunit ribosomal protein S17
MPNRDIGIDVKAPAREPAPGDRLNPFNGSLSVRGSLIVGTVVTSRMQGTVVVEKQRQTLVEKFERYEKRTRRYPAHVPSNIDCAVGDEVTIAECRPISKTVNFVVVENRGNPAAKGLLRIQQRNVPAKPEPKKPKPEAAKAGEAKSGEKAAAPSPAGSTTSATAAKADRPRAKPAPAARKEADA